MEDIKRIKKKTIITYGTFNMFYIGYLKLVKRLEIYYNRLIITVCTDESSNRIQLSEF